MNKQIRFLIADPGDLLAGTIADSLRKEGAWAVIRQQTRTALLHGIRTEHPDVLIVNLMYPTLDFPTFADDILKQTELEIVALYRTGGLFLESLMEMKNIYCWRIPPETAQITKAICEKLLQPNTHRGLAGSEPSPCPDPALDAANLLRSLGISPKSNGFAYLRYAIVRTAGKQNEDRTGNSLYAELAEMFGSNYDCVEHSIRHVLKKAWNTANEDPDHASACSWMLLPLKTNRCPANLEFITAAAAILRQSFRSRGIDPAQIVPKRS